MEKRCGIGLSSTILVLLLLLGTFFVVTPGTSVADQDGDYTYTTDGHVATITGYTGAGGAIVIPSTLGGYPTAAIGLMAFSNKGSLASIIIPSGVNSIGGWAFVSCASLVTVSMPDGLVSIGDSAFAYCSALTSLSIPNSVSSIGEGAFFGAASLTSVNMPSNLTTIGQYAFASTSLSSLTVPANVTSIGDQAFNALTTLAAIDVSEDNAFYCSVDGVLYDKNATTLIQCAGGKVGGLIIPDSVTSIGDYAFNGCDSLSSVAIPDSVTSIGMTAFRYCDSMTSVNIPGGVTTIKDSTFQQCSSLTCIVIPDSVTTIEYNAFGGCGSLTTVTLGRGVVSIGNGVFFDCTSLTSITFLGLVAPTTVGTDWIADTSPEIKGHAYADSNFPKPGNDFHGLIMGDELSQSDSTMLLLIIMAIAILAIIMAAIMIRGSRK